MTLFTKANVAMFIMVLVALVTLGLIVWATLTHQPTPDVVNTLLGVVLGFLGTNLASAQGAAQALATPPPAPLDEGRAA